MAYTMESLKKKILEMHPEIVKHDLGVEISFSAGKDAYLVTFRRRNDELTTQLEKKDADECMNGIKCVYLGVQVAQFIRNFDEKEIFERSAA